MAIIGIGAIKGTNDTIMMMTISSPNIFPKSLIERDKGREKCETTSMGKISQANHQAGPIKVLI